jgi:hypothetical protein
MGIGDPEDSTAPSLVQSSLQRSRNLQHLVPAQSSVRLAVSLENRGEERSDEDAADRKGTAQRLSEVRRPPC